MDAEATARCATSLEHMVNNCDSSNIRKYPAVTAEVVRLRSFGFSRQTNVEAK